MGKQLTVKSKGGRGGARRSRARQSTTALLLRLRRTEHLLMALLSPQNVRWLTDTRIKAMLQDVIDGWAGNNGEEIRIPQTGSVDGQGEGNDAARSGPARIWKRASGKPPQAEPPQGEEE